MRINESRFGGLSTSVSAGETVAGSDIVLKPEKFQLGKCTSVRGGKIQLLSWYPSIIHLYKDGEAIGLVRPSPDLCTKISHMINSRNA